jgi:ribonuclease HI
MTGYMVFTDGACHPNPGPGGWAAIFAVNGEKVKVLKGSERATTNNRMELTAALRALESVPENSFVTIHTDSQYLMMGITRWLPGWVKRGWKRAGGTLANEDLWKALYAQTQRVKIKWKWLRGHAGTALNEMADREARRAIPR